MFKTVTTNPIYNLDPESVEFPFRTTTSHEVYFVPGSPPMPPGVLVKVIGFEIDSRYTGGMCWLIVREGRFAVNRVGKSYINLPSLRTRKVHKTILEFNLYV